MPIAPAWKTLRSTCALVGALILVSPAFAQETYYVSDELLVPLRSGAGNNYRILHRGLPSGTQVQVFTTSEDGDWMEVETVKGTKGWLPTQYLQQEQPAAVKLARAEANLAKVTAERDALKASLSSVKGEASELGSTSEALQTELDATKAELAEIRRISSNAVALDRQNQALVADLETQRSEAELLKLENVRLQERISSNLLLDGAVAVLLGVVIAIVAPRLWPRKRRNDGWA